MSEYLVDINHERLSFFTPAGEVKALNDVSIHVKEGEVLGIVGESGSGKSVTAYSLMGLTAYPGKLIGGTLEFNGHKINEMTEKEMRKIRGNEVSIIFQDPMTSLNPVYTIGNQIEEVILLHTDKKKKEAHERAKELLTLVGINEPEKRLKQYPHELSGGMRQRVMIAIALACEPKLLIADEPTTALDVTIQAQILELMMELKDKLGMAIIMITHDLGIVASMCEKIAVMYAGRIVEYGTTDEIFYEPKHEYTKGLLRSIPKLDAREHEKLVPIEGTPIDLLNPPKGCPFAPRCNNCMKICLREMPPVTTFGDVHYTQCWMNQKEERQVSDKLVEVQHLKQYFPAGGYGKNKRYVKAVDDVSFYVNKGETLGLVGESGCGKTTTGRTLLRLYEPTAGKIIYDDQVIFDGEKKIAVDMLPYRKKMQIVFQDPYASLDPRMTVADIIGEAIDIHKLAANKQERYDIIIEMLRRVGLNSEHANRYPHEFSGGQRQRVGIARALAVNPQFIVCDEPISALDVSIQAQVINMFEDLQQELGLTYLFIAHDLSVVKHISNRIGVMYLGKLVELADSYELTTHSVHPYTKSLISAIPIADPKTARQNKRIVLEGDVPSPLNPPSGCRFRTRCPYATEQCAAEQPEWREISAGHYVACHHPCV